MRWGVLGAANFAKQHMAPAIHAAKGAELYALATSSPEKAAGFQAFAPGLAIHDSYDALLADPMVDAVYIPLPNHLHVEWSVKALEAGKHVLCEKPMTLAAPEFDQLIAARDKAGKLAAEAFMIVHHPQFARARELVQAGAIGALR
ncbi:MAG: Gfo/Idh/MocA family oxidoreductase, partial [Loktanella sp.]|nr:Gfo/Idh/MocA family oxidoreductase [Loktanella sp.]